MLRRRPRAEQEPTAGVVQTSTIEGLGSCPLVIVGMHRSGTSATSLALRALGLYIGSDDDLKGGDEFNQDGYGENRKMIALNFGVMSEFETTGSLLHELPKNWHDFPEYAPWMKQALSVLPEALGGHEFWGWKNPQSALMLPFFLEVFRKLERKPYFIMPVRNPLDVANSLARRDNMPQLAAIGAWMHYTLTALKDLQDEDLLLFSYSDFLENPRACLEPRILSLPVTAPSDETWAEVRKVVRPELSNSAKSLRDLDAPGLEFVKRVYAAALDAARDPEGFRNGAYRDRFQLMWEEWRNLGALRAPAYAQGAVLLWWKRILGDSPIHSEVFSNDREWHSTRVNVEGMDGHRIIAHFDFPPSIVYIRRIECMTQEGPATPTIKALPGAYLQPMGEGAACLIAHGKGDHCLFELPPTGRSLEFGFEYRVDQTVRASKVASHLLSDEVVALRR